MVDITSRIAKAIGAVLYIIIFGITELAMKIDLFIKGQISLLDAFKQTLTDLISNGFVNAPNLLWTSIALFQTSQPVLGSVRLFQFAMFVFFLAIILSIPAYLIGVVGAPIGFIGLIIWSLINTFLLGLIINTSLPSLFGVPFGWIILVIVNIVFIITAYLFNKGNKK